MWSNFQAASRHGAILQTHQMDVIQSCWNHR